MSTQKILKDPWARGALILSAALVVLLFGMDHMVAKVDAAEPYSTQAKPGSVLLAPSLQTVIQPNGSTVAPEAPIMEVHPALAQPDVKLAKSSSSDINCSAITPQEDSTWAQVKAIAAKLGCRLGFHSDEDEAKQAPSNE